MVLYLSQNSTSLHVFFIFQIIFSFGSFYFFFIIIIPEFRKIRFPRSYSALPSDAVLLFTNRIYSLWWDALWCGGAHGKTDEPFLHHMHCFFYSLLHRWSRARENNVSPSLISLTADESQTPQYRKRSKNTVRIPTGWDQVFLPDSYLCATR